MRYFMEWLGTIWSAYGMGHIAYILTRYGINELTMMVVTGDMLVFVFAGLIVYALGNNIKENKGETK